MFVRGISEIAELKVSLKRLRSFLLNEEYHDQPETVGNGNSKYIEATKESIRIDNVCAKWNRNNSDMALDNINLSVRRGNLIGIIGPVGSGKSSLLQTILGNYKINSVFGQTETSCVIFLSSS